MRWGRNCFYFIIISSDVLDLIHCQNRSSLAPTIKIRLRVYFIQSQSPPLFLSL